MNSPVTTSTPVMSNTGPALLKVMTFPSLILLASTEPRDHASWRPFSFLSSHDPMALWFSYVSGHLPSYPMHLQVLPLCPTLIGGSLLISILGLPLFSVNTLSLFPGLSNYQHVGNFKLGPSLGRSFWGAPGPWTSLVSHLDMSITPYRQDFQPDPILLVPSCPKRSTSTSAFPVSLAGIHPSIHPTTIY